MADRTIEVLQIDGKCNNGSRPDDKTMFGGGWKTDQWELIDGR